MLSLSSSNGFTSRFPATSSNGISSMPCGLGLRTMWVPSRHPPWIELQLKGMVGVLQYIYNFISKAPSETLDTIIHWFNHTQTFSRASLTRACHCMFLKFCSHETHCNIKRSTTSKIGKAIHGIQTLSMLSSSHGSTFKANNLTSFNCQAIIFSTFILEDQSDCFMKNGRLMIRQEYLLI